MELFYKEFQASYLDLLRPDILEFVESNRNLWTTDQYHCRFQFNKESVLTSAGLEIFKHSSSTVDFFRVPPGHVSGIHVDSSWAAFNFIIKGNGFMEWFDFDDLEESHKSPYGTPVFKLAKGKEIKCRTLANTILVDTKIPHRIVNESTVERICVSIRYTNPAYKFINIRDQFK